jgi:uncharacterized iron-regulated protein
MTRRSVRHLPLVLSLLPLLAACASGSPHGATTPGPTPGPAAPEPEPRAVEGETFHVYTGDGEPASLDDVVAAMAEHEAVLVGEEHNDDVTHLVQADLLRHAYTTYAAGAGGPLPEGHPPVPRGEGRPVVLSLEMFERDVQYVVDEYLEGLITEDHFLRSARPWENYAEHYRPMVEFARVHGVPVVAANAPRRYVNRASRLGRDSLFALGPTARRYLPPLPYPEPSQAYREEWDAVMGDAARHMSPTLIDAQALWDAAMGEAVAEVLDARPDALVLHMAGGFHVENGTGTPEALAHYRPGTRTLLVAARPADDPSRFDPESHAGLGDFVVLTRRR